MQAAPYPLRRAEALLVSHLHDTRMGSYEIYEMVYRLAAYSVPGTLAQTALCMGGAAIMTL
jgi:hypothetical protein